MSVFNSIYCLLHSKLSFYKRKSGKGSIPGTKSSPSFPEKSGKGKQVWNSVIQDQMTQTFQLVATKWYTGDKLCISVRSPWHRAFKIPTIILLLIYNEGFMVDEAIASEFKWIMIVPSFVTLIIHLAFVVHFFPRWVRANMTQILRTRVKLASASIVRQKGCFIVFGSFGANAPYVVMIRFALKVKFRTSGMGQVGITWFIYVEIFGNQSAHEVAIRL